MSELTPSDMMAMMNNSNGGMNNWSNNPFFYLIFMWMFGGWGGFGARGAAAGVAASEALTRAEMADGFANQNLQNDVRANQSSIVNGTASLTQSLNNGFAGVQQSLCSGFSGVNSTINSTSNDTIGAINVNADRLSSAINQTNFNNQMGFNNVTNSVNNLKYEMAQNCCDLKTAMHQEGEATRAQITANQIQDLRDRLAEKDNALQSANLTLANANQTQNILSSMGRFVPYKGSACCDCF